MDNVPVTEMKNRLSHYLRLVRAGARVTIVDRGRPVAVLAPAAAVDDDIGDLVARGVASGPEQELPPDFLKRELPEPRQSVVAALVEDREDRF